MFPVCHVPISHRFSRKKTQPRSQGLLRHVVATAWFSPEPSFLSLVAQVLEYKCNLCHHSVFAETNPLNLANSIRRSERPGKSDATWEKEQPRRRLGYPDERVTSQHTLSGEGYVCLPPPNTSPSYPQARLAVLPVQSVQPSRALQTGERHFWMLYYLWKADPAPRLSAS